MNLKKVDKKTALVLAVLGFVVGDIVDLSDRIPFLRTILDKIKGGVNAG